MAKPTKRNPQDATLRNIRALKARVAKLERIVRDLRIVGIETPYSVTWKQAVAASNRLKKEPM